MVCCDQCGQWLHGDCVRITEEEAETLDTYVCSACKEQGTRNLPIPISWYPGGPSCSFFPYPVADAKRPWGGKGCTTCVGDCYGHYVTDVTELLNLYAVDKALRCPPPTEILADFHKSHNGGCIEDADVSMLAKKCLLSTDDIKLWLQHLTQVSINRKRGAEKAKATREKQNKEK